MVTCHNLVKITGGTIGLFMGMSIVSVIEAIYWIYRVRKKSLIRNMEIKLCTVCFIAGDLEDVEE